MRSLTDKGANAWERQGSEREFYLVTEPYHQKPSLLIFRQPLRRPAWKCKAKKQTGVQGRLHRSPSTPNWYVSGNTASPPSLWLVRVRCSSHGWSWYLYTRAGRGDLQACNISVSQSAC